ncbi:hypothetical protein ANN_26379 [Periplaneta americana]|uniref:Uncharacterized protein n=1 Tax=Periplaneta americana TaxID=6978 RepID=A0ABQ8RXX2_PERAM|nr:hypothetical protein ANN_26379 [Periplaneta americana]
MKATLLSEDFYNTSDFMCSVMMHLSVRANVKVTVVNDATIYYIALLNVIHRNRNKFKLCRQKYGNKISDIIRLEEPKCFTSTALSHEPHGPLFLAGLRFVSDDDAKTAARLWFHARPTEFYISNNYELVVRWDKCLDRTEDCVEK